MSDVVLALLTMLCRAVVKNPWENHRSKTRAPYFLRDILCRHWEEVHPRYPDFCLILQGCFTPHQLETFDKSCDLWTTGAHIIPQSCEGFCTLERILNFRWDGLDVPQNGLPLCRVFEVAFDKLQICFVCTDGRWRVRVLDRSLHGQVNFITADGNKPTRSAPVCAFSGSLHHLPPSPCVIFLVMRREPTSANLSLTLYSLVKQCTGMFQSCLLCLVSSLR